MRCNLISDRAWGKPQADGHVRRNAIPARCRGKLAVASVRRTVSASRSAASLPVAQQFIQAELVRWRGQVGLIQALGRAVKHSWLCGFQRRVLAGASFMHQHVAQHIHSRSFAGQAVAWRTCAQQCHSRTYVGQACSRVGSAYSLGRWVGGIAAGGPTIHSSRTCPLRGQVGLIQALGPKERSDQ